MRWRVSLLEGGEKKNREIGPSNTTRMNKGNCFSHDSGKIENSNSGKIPWNVSGCWDINHNCAHSKMQTPSRPSSG